MQTPLKHPYAETPKEQIAEMACAYLPDDGTDWQAKCIDAIDWLNERADEQGDDDGDFFHWRANDPIHVACLAFENMGFAYCVGRHDITETPNPAYEAGMRYGWGKLLAKLHSKRLSYYHHKKQAGVRDDG